MAETMRCSNSALLCPGSRERPAKREVALLCVRAGVGERPVFMCEADGGKIRTFGASRMRAWSRRYDAETVPSCIGVSRGWPAKRGAAVRCDLGGLGRERRIWV